jgi:hypothetical protein
MQGIGVNAPSAAAVAAATIGLAIDLHMPKGRILSIGILSITVAAGMPVMTALAGNTIKVPGASPIEHLSIAPPQTCLGIITP